MSISVAIAAGIVFLASRRIKQQPATLVIVIRHR